MTLTCKGHARCKTARRPARYVVFQSDCGHCRYLGLPECSGHAACEDCTSEARQGGPAWPEQKPCVVSRVHSLSPPTQSTGSAQAGER